MGVLSAPICITLENTMKMRKHKRLRQEWAGRDEFRGHSYLRELGRTACWMSVGWRRFK